jgi:shikimate dehydrogenase
MTEPIKAFICGWPVEHSRSPVIHQYWLRQHQLHGDYIKQAVAKEELKDFLKNIKHQGFIGGNITLPHKEQACALVDILDPVAKGLGAVNTVWLENGKLHGKNTDTYGFLANLNQLARGWDEPQTDTPAVIVLGAGGASRAIIHGLQSRGFSDIRLVNRTISRAIEVASNFAPGVSAHEWRDLPELMRDCCLLINTTSLGMVAKPPLKIDLAPLPAHCLVHDIIYVPLKTKLLEQAENRGLKTVDGLGMLLHQAVPGFEKWFGIRPKVTPELRQKVIQDLGLSQ